MRSVRDTISLLKSACAGVFLAAASFAVHGQTPTVYTEAGQLIRAPQAVTSLGPDLFGDKVNLYSGVLEFTQTDVSIPGNNALPVSVGRRLSTGNWANATGAFGRWELEIPHLHGVFASAGWVTKAGNNNRCTEFGAPAGARGVGGIAMWSAEDFWHGNFIYVPGVGDQEMLMRDARNANIPSSGGPHPVVTRDLWAFRCLPTLANDPAGTMGQGFLAIAPDGTQYRFDQLVTRNYEGVSRVEDMSPSLAADATASADAPPPANIATCCGLGRKEVWILPTRVTDRFGNYVSYTYSAAKPANVTSIVSSDGRRLTLTYITDIDGERVSSVSDGTRTWTYAYHGVNEQTDLARVTLPDGSSWNLGDISALLGRWHYLVSGDCDTLGTVAERPMVGAMVHPSGAIGQFTLTAVRHGRSQTYRQCRGNSDVATYAVNPHKYDTFSLTSKTLSGPGMPATAWSYDYGPDNGSWEGCTGCMETVTTSVTDPNGERTEYTFGNHHRRNEGRLLSTNTGGMRTVSMHYRDASAGPYPSVPGHSDQTRGDSAVNAQFAPVDQRITRQQGVDFSWQASAFDTRARALTVTRSSSLGYSRTETTAYFDQPATWVLGQVQSVTEGSTGKAMVSTAYHAANATPLSVSRFGQLQQSYTYASDGTLQTIKDGNNRTTTYSDYKRGLAQTIRYPDNTVERAVVSDLGLVSALTNQVGTTTSYGYDAMGRLASITHPGADSVAWNATTIAFAPVAGVEYGIGAGHWRQTVTTGNRLDVQYFDALWRPVLSRSYDAANEAATRKMVTRRFDFRGNSAFESYPQRTIGAVTDAVAGVATTYDALGRATLVSASSELGTLNTVTGYTSGFEKSVRNARNQVTTMRFQAFDEPSDGAISNIGAPEGVTVAIARDVFGKPTSVTRSGAGKSAARRYVYDSYQRLCKSIEPETGATVQDYDGANNVAWRASGLALPATASCDTAYGYDLRNRLTGTSFVRTGRWPRSGTAAPAASRQHHAEPARLAVDVGRWRRDQRRIHV